jgi:hypothetical protein
MEEKDAATLAHEYIERQDKIEVLESECKLIKDALRVQLPYEEQGIRAWKFPDTHVEWAKGRRTEKVDTTKLRTQLVLLGVDAKVLDEAFEKATTITVGEPTIRVSHLK